MPKQRQRGIQTERTGFEPAEPVARLTDLANRRFRPLSHRSLHRLGRAGETSLGKRSLHTLNGRDCAANSQFTQPSVYRLQKTCTLSVFHGFFRISAREDLISP